MAKVLVRYGVHSLEQTGPKTAALVAQRFRGRGIVFEEMPAEKTLHSLLLKKAGALSSQVFPAERRLRRIMKKYEQKMPVLRIGDPKLAKLVRQRGREIGCVLSQPAVRKAKRIVDSCFRKACDYRRRLNENAVRQGLIPVELHSHASSTFEIFYHPKFRTQAEKLGRDMQRRGHDVIVRPTPTVRAGPHISIELPGEMKRTLLARQLDLKVPRFLKNNAPSTWAAYSSVPTKPMLRQSQRFLSDALRFLVRL